MYLKDGCFIYGEWRQGELMRGLLIYPNGDFYEGSFSKQQIDGMGNRDLLNTINFFE